MILLFRLLSEEHCRLLHIRHALTYSVTELSKRTPCHHVGMTQTDVVMQVVNLPRGFAYVEFASREDAERARSHMDGGQLDGNTLR